MIKTSGEFEQELIAAAREKTGLCMDEWMKIIKMAGFTKQKTITNWLKAGHKLNHLQASLLAGIYLNNGKAVYNKRNLLDNQFEKCKNMRPLFNKISEGILSGFPGVQCIPKKTYISFAGIREFAAVSIRPASVCLGMDLGKISLNSKLQMSKIAGPVSRISHMVVLTSAADFDTAIIEYLQLSYYRTHNKTT